MAEMSKIEEVARALCVQMGEDPDQKTKYHPKRNFVWEHYISAARAAIEAMREPTNAMLMAMWHVHHPWGVNAPSPADRPGQWALMVKETKAGLNAMIDAALSEEVAG